MKKLVFILLLAFPFMSLFSQNDKEAAKIVDDFISLIQNNSIQADFTLKILDEHDRPVQVQTGKLTMKGNKFHFNLESAEVIYDGTTQWSYMEAVNEVTISEPTGKELAEIHPLIILTENRQDYTILFSKKTTSPTEYVIDMISNIPANEFEEMELFFNKANKKINSIGVWGAGFNMKVEFSKFESGINISDSYFVFDKSKYKGVFENDLR